MTVIAWDGKTLAADRRLTCSGVARSTTKIERSQSHLLGMAGNWDIACELRQWFKAGAEPAAFPAEARKDLATLVVIGSDGTVNRYDAGPYPTRIEDEKVAFGSGAAYADAAMHLGKSARVAVGVACNFDTGCGNGIDILSFDSE